MREGESTMLGRVLTSLFGLMIIWNGLILFSSRNFAISSAASGLKSIKATGQALGAQAEAFLTVPFVTSASSNTQFSIFSDIPSLIFWLVVTIMLLSVIWMPVSSKKAS
jgi:hypothetical protein